MLEQLKKISLEFMLLHISPFSAEVSFISLYISFQGKYARVPCATVGPEEPHATSTAWPDGVLEKQELDLENFEFDRAALEGFLNSKLPSHPKLYRGQLKNGLRYLILPNKVPPSRYGSLTVSIFKLLDSLLLNLALGMFCMPVNMVQLIQRMKLSISRKKAILISFILRYLIMRA